MNNNACREFSDQLESWTEGGRTASADAHFRECARCRSLAADLGLIEAAARDWAGAGCEPPAYLWTSLRAQLET
ncbi:MAG: hypothetical protein ACREQC_05690, partial [Candidatus Binataceae bacterium]